MLTGIAEQEYIQHVEPNDGLVTLVIVVVPVPCGRDDDVSAHERHLLALDGGKALAVHDEATGIGNVSMSRRRLRSRPVGGMATSARLGLLRGVV